MNPFFRPSLGLSFGLPLIALLASGPALAEPMPTPPIKPGLWLVHTEREVDGKKAPDVGDHLKTMPPEMRSRMEANMRQHGVDMLGGGDMRMCMTRESMDQGRWQGHQERCKTDLTSRSGNTWKWHSVCTQPASESDGEVVFFSPESYSVKMDAAMQVQGRSAKSKMSMTAKWLGADCGELKPVMPPPKPGAKP